MAARTFTSAGVNNLWSNVANWDGGTTIPAEDDSVTIPAGQTCEYDYNSAYTTGIAGITIAATATLKLTRTPGTYRLFMKAATTIGGAGTFDCGASALDPIPFAAKHTITGGAAWYINGAAGLTMTVYAAEPTIKTVLLTVGEAIGATVLRVDTSVIGDLWAEGDTIRIDNVNKAANSEERVIAAGGIAAGTITITAGLTAAKIAGSVVSLITRNVKFIGVGAAGYVAQNFAAGKLTIAGGQWMTAAHRIFSCTANISGGSFSGNAYAFYGSCSNSTITGGVFSGNANGIAFNAVNMSISGGYFSGNGAIYIGCYGCSISGGIFKGMNYIIYGGLANGIFGGTFLGITSPVFNAAAALVNGVTITSTVNGVYVASAVLRNVVFTDVTYHIRQSVVSLFSCDLQAGTEAYDYNMNSRESYSESIDHDQVAGAYKAWTKGGVTSSQAVTVPTGYTTAMQTVLENAAVEGYWQKEYTVGPGASIQFTANLRKAVSMTYLPRCIIFNKASADPFAGGAGLHTFTMTDSIDTWEAESWTYTNSTAADVTLVVRFQGMHATATFYSALLAEQINVDLTTALAQIAAVKAKTDNLPADPADESALEAAIAAITVDNAAIAAAVMGSTVEGTITTAQALRLILAVLAGKASGGGTTTVKFRDTADTKDRVTATTDSNGNRSAVVLDGA